MIFRVEDTLAIAGRHLAPALVPPQALRELRRAARSIPRVAHAVGFECRLRGDASRVDLGVTVDPVNGGREALARWRPAAACARRARSAWTPIVAFCARWAHPQTHLDVVSRLFLELDGGGSSAAGFAPSVFAQLDPAALRSDASGKGLLSPLDEAVGLWRGRGAARQPARRLRRIVAALPPGAEILAIGAMLGREGGAVRLSVRLARIEVAPTLAALGWPERGRGLARALEACGRQRTIALDLDLESTKAPIGLQLSADQVRGRTRSWAALLDRLVARGWCTRDKRDALLAWPGMSTEKVPGLGWPCSFERYLSNLKLAVSPDGSVEAKAYFAAVARFTLVDRR